MKYCFNGNDCVFTRCIFHHKPRENVDSSYECALGNDCDRKICSFQHPPEFYERRLHKRERPHDFQCFYGNRCHRGNCHFAHSPKYQGQQEECLWKMQCTRAVCDFVHFNYSEQPVPGFDGGICCENACEGEESTLEPYDEGHVVEDGNGYAQGENGDVGVEEEDADGGECDHFCDNCSRKMS